MAEVLSSLTKYVNENNLNLIRKSVLGDNSSKYFVLQTGVVGSTAVNLLDTDVTFGNGLNCGWEEAGTSTVSQRKLNPVHVKVNMSFCDRKMQDYFLNQEIRVAAGQETLPAEEAFMAGVLDSINEGVEDLIWNGSSADGVKKDGLLDIAKKSSLVAEKGADIYAATLAVYNLIPAGSLKDSVIYMGIDKFRELALNLTAKNLFHSDIKVDENFEFILPGTSTLVRGVAGLSGKDAIVALNDKHTFYGVDMQGDEEMFDLWYSKDNQEFRLAVKFNAGVQVAFLDEVVYCNLGA